MSRNRLPRGLRRLPDGSYRIRTAGPDGRLIDRRAGRDRARAEDLLVTLQREARPHAGRRAAPADSNPKVRDYLTRYVGGRTDLAPSSVRNFDGMIANYLPGYALADLRIRSVTVEDVDEYLERLAGQPSRYTGAPLSAGTVRLMRRLLSLAFRDAERRGLIDRNPVALVRGPAYRPPRIDPPSRDQVRRLLEGVEEDRLAALYVVAVQTGIRQGEAFGLRWRDLDLEADPPVMRIRFNLRRDGTLGPPKTRRSARDLELPAPVAEALRRHRVRQQVEEVLAGEDYHPEGWVFTRPDGRVAVPRVVLSQLAAHLERLGIAAEREAAGQAPVRYHDLRHAYATIALEAGASLEEVSRYLGHDSLATTADIYAHTTPDRRRAYIARIEEAFR